MSKKLILFLIIFLFTNSIICFSDDSNYYDDYNYFLSNVVLNGRVNYEKAGEDFMYTKLIRFLQFAGIVRLSAISPDEKLALLINIYNAATIKLIIENYPVNSIMEIDNPWSTKISVVQGENVTLDYLEKNIIFNEFDDARIHFLLNCSAVSCPPLLPYALTGDNIDENLEGSAYNFINNSTFNKFEVVLNTSFFRRNDQRLVIYLSEIFSWYENDFINHFGSVKDCLIEYISNREYKEFLNDDNFEISYMIYDWELNRY